MQVTLADRAANRSEPGKLSGALAHVHRLLTRPPGDQPPLATLLAELASAFEVSACGLAGLPDCRPHFRHPPSSTPTNTLLPWQEDPSLLTLCRQAPGAVTLDHPHGRLLATTFSSGDGRNWVLWLEGDHTTFDDANAAALALAGHALSRLLPRETGAAGTRWVEQLDLATRQEHLEAVAAVAGRLAHDFGNILTGILGFTELALAQQVPSSTALHTFLQEVFRAAQAGAQFTQQLRLFARRQAGSSRSSQLATLLAEQEARLFAVQPTGLNVQLSVPADLPPVALDADQLHQVLTPLLDNAREALMGPGAISVSARTLNLEASDCQDLYGACQPGPHVEVVIADTGQGLSSDVRRRLFAVPFFTSKPRRRGFGLAVAYGILHVHKGGLRLHPGEERGVVVRVLLPVAPKQLEGSTWAAPPGEGWPVRETAGTSRQAAPVPEGERVLVVDDEPDILRYVSVALEKDGFRVVSAGSSDAAMKAYAGAAADPFHLVLTDVIMPGMGGVDLARRLLRRDPSVRVLFMSGHVPSAGWGDAPRQGEGPLPPFEMLAKPFRPEQLTRAVRAALNRQPRPGADRPAQESPEGCLPGRLKR